MALLQKTSPNYKIFEIILNPKPTIKYVPAIEDPAKKEKDKISLLRQLSASGHDLAELHKSLQNCAEKSKRNMDTKSEVKIDDGGVFNMIY
jgi:hypothetical protein